MTCLQTVIQASSSDRIFLSVLFCGWCLVCGWISLAVPRRTEDCDSNCTHKDIRAKGHAPVYLCLWMCETLDIHPKVFLLSNYDFLLSNISLNFTSQLVIMTWAPLMLSLILCCAWFAFFQARKYTPFACHWQWLKRQPLFWVGRWRCVYSVSDAALSFCRLFCFLGNNNLSTLQRSLG